MQPILSWNKPILRKQTIHSFLPKCERQKKIFAWHKTRVMVWYRCIVCYQNGDPSLLSCACKCATLQEVFCHKGQVIRCSAAARGTSPGGGTRKRGLSKGLIEFELWGGVPITSPLPLMTDVPPWHTAPGNTAKDHCNHTRITDNAHHIFSAKKSGLLFIDTQQNAPTFYVKKVRIIFVGD